VLAVQRRSGGREIWANLWLLPGLSESSVFATDLTTISAQPIR
jgi:hypothetical protein